MSSTGHLLLVQQFFGFDDDDFGKTFAVLIQLGAILALLSIYFGRIWAARASACSRDPAARALRHRRADRIPAGGGDRRARPRLHQVSICSTCWIVCFTLIVGGAILLWVDQHESQAALSRRHAVFAADVSRHRHLAQCISMIPACRARAPPSSAPCCSAPTSARRRNSRSSSRCRPWSAPSPTISTRTAAD